MIKMNYQTKFLLEPDMKQKTIHLRIFITIVLAAVLLVPLMVQGQTDAIPERPSPPRLVNDFTGFLSSAEQNQLERKLVAFNDSTSTQIVIIIVKSLNGYEVSDMATQIGHKWGVGQKGKNNGIVILVKPKTKDEKGYVWIATGYGAESGVTDALSKRIIEQDIIPAFNQGQNYQGLDKAVSTLYSLLRGEFTPNQYLGKKKKSMGSKFPIALIVVIGIIIFSIFRRNSSGGPRQFSSGGIGPIWMGSGSSSGSFGDFQSGGNEFGGFGGGDFGGGGAGGSW
jgi:uncharacterized protein